MGDSKTANAASALFAIGLAIGVLGSFGAATVSSNDAHAQDAPLFYAVTGVPADDKLHMRDVPHGDSKILGDIPAKARGLKGLGCLKPQPSLDRWMEMTEDERKNAKLEWCRVEYKGQQGWVAGRFLKPDK